MKRTLFSVVFCLLIGALLPLQTFAQGRHLRDAPSRCKEDGPYRFATLNLLPDEVMLLHIDGYAPTRGAASSSCQIHVAFVSEEVVLQEGTFTISPNRTVDTAFYGPATGVLEAHPVITPVGSCNLDIVPLLQVQQRVQAGAGKTLYIYPGQFSVPLRSVGDVGSATK